MIFHKSKKRKAKKTPTFLTLRKCPLTRVHWVGRWPLWCLTMRQGHLCHQSRSYWSCPDCGGRSCCPSAVSQFRQTIGPLGQFFVSFVFHRAVKENWKLFLFMNNWHLNLYFLTYFQWFEYCRECSLTKTNKLDEPYKGHRNEQEYIIHVMQVYHHVQFERHSLNTVFLCWATVTLHHHHGNQNEHEYNMLCVPLCKWMILDRPSCKVYPENTTFSLTYLTSLTYIVCLFKAYRRPTTQGHLRALQNMYIT